MKATAVIGANFGDEGKGRIVDHFAASADAPCVVIRYNGGAQAGHTVVTPDGRRHVFSHIGSGSFVGASTYLSEFFIANPFLFAKEFVKLKKVSHSADIYCHEYTPISTPYDMLLNREAETWRGNQRHDSCGYGVAETVERLCRGGFSTFAKDILTNGFRDTLAKIKAEYVPQRLARLGIRKPSDWFRDSIECDGLLSEYYNNLELMGQSIKITRSGVLKTFKSVIFEGAQGLCLDERHRFFPHVTRSKTGLTNIETICEHVGIRSLDVLYVSRAYLTRHGVGPLPTEDANLEYEDTTNTENEWQGKLRFGCLDIDLMAENIKEDLGRVSLKAHTAIALTCFDQIASHVTIKCKMQTKEIDKDALPKLLAGDVGVDRVIVSRSPGRLAETEQQ